VAVCVAAVESIRPHRRGVAIGRIIGDTANAHGKMFAACEPDEEREAIVNPALERNASEKITDADERRDRLEQARLLGIALDLEERDTGTCAGAAPVRDQTGKVIATLAVVVSAGRFDDQARDACAAAVRDTAASFSTFFGYAGSGGQAPWARPAPASGGTAQHVRLDPERCARRVRALPRGRRARIADGGHLDAREGRPGAGLSCAADCCLTVSSPAV
jgi:hypothetical protein